MIALDDIRKTFEGRIAVNEPLAPYTTFRIGGPADIYLEPLTKADACSLIQYLHANSVEFFLMGNGSNLLISDDGIRGAVLNLEAGFAYARMQDDGKIVAGAGIRLAKFVDFCIENGKGGAEMLAGIPGTLGGGIIMNAGAYGGEISDHLVSVEVIQNDRLTSMMKDDCDFKYRSSNLARSVVVEAVFDFPEGDAPQMKTKRRETMLKRNTSQPVQFPNAGSIFKNPPGMYAAKLIEESGLKGRRVGGAEISDLHANFIVNKDKASAKDVLTLIGIAREEVLRVTGVELELEVKLVGFPTAEIGHLHARSIQPKA